MDDREHLQSGSLSFIEVLATSIALIGPSMTPVLIAPNMFAAAGNATWLAYLFGGIMLVFVALNLNQFTRRSASAGSMYQYAHDNLGSVWGGIAGWSLLWAYTFVAAATLGAMGLFVDQLAFLTFGGHVPPALTMIAVALVCWQAAYRGVQVSAILMLVLEAVSVSIICLIVGLVLFKHGFTIDRAQLTLHGATPSGIGIGIASVAVFSLVGFESASAFGEEASRPLVTIPRAIIWSVVLASAFFIVATYAEILALHGSPKSLDQLTAPLATIAELYNVPFLRIPITAGAFFSAFSVTLACVTTASRVALAMGRSNAIPAAFARIEPTHETPHVGATVFTAVSLAVALAGALVFKLQPNDVFNDAGDLSSCGFIAIYALVAVAAPIFVRKLGTLRAADVAIAVVAVLFLLAPTVTLFYPAPAFPTNWFPYAFVAYILCAWLYTRSRVTR